MVHLGDMGVPTLNLAENPPGSLLIASRHTADPVGLIETYGFLAATADFPNWV